MRKILESALFISGKPMALEELATMAGTGSIQKVKEELLALKQDYDQRESPMRISELEDGRFKMELHSDYLRQVRSLAPHMDMKRAVVTVLSHIALKQVVLQSELVHKFGNRVYEYIKDLEKRALVRTEPYRHTKKIITTKKLYALIGEEDANAVSAQLETAKAELEAQKQAQIAGLQPVYKTRANRRRTNAKIPERDITPEQWMEKIKADQQKSLAKQMDQFEGKSRKKKDNLEEDYAEVFELKGGNGNNTQEKIR